MKIKEIMTKDPAFCTKDTTLDVVARMMEESDCGQIPIVESEKNKLLLGVVTDRDIVIRALAQGKNPLSLKASDVMSSPAVPVTPDTEIEECCRTLEEMQVRRVPVVDEKGRCCGMVSQADIAHHAPPEMTAEVLRVVSQPL